MGRFRLAFAGYKASFFPDPYAHRYIETQMNIHRQTLLMLMNTINKFEQPNTEQADRRCAFSRSFTRMFDRLCAFLDERIGGASELIDACQSVADRFCTASCTSRFAF